MNINEPNRDNFNLHRASLISPDRPATEEELLALATDIVKFCPSLTHLLIALGSKNGKNPLEGLN